MPIFVTGHVRAGKQVRAYSRAKAIGNAYAVANINKSREASIKSLYGQTMKRSQRKLEIKRINSYHNARIASAVGKPMRRPR